MAEAWIIWTARKETPYTFVPAKVVSDKMTAEYEGRTLMPEGLFVCITGPHTLEAPAVLKPKRASVEPGPTFGLVDRRVFA